MMFESSSFWTVVVLLGLGTITVRCSVILFSSKIKISDRAKEVLSFIPAAILPALVAPMAFFHKGSVEPLGGKERLVVIIAATLLCYLTRNMLLTISFGLACLYFISQVF